MAEDLVPEEIEEQCLQCHHSLVAIDRMLKPVLDVGRLQLEERLDPLEAASLVLLLSYTMNSLFWVSLPTQGINPKTHLIKRELDRIQKIMHKAKIISDRRAGRVPKLNQSAAKRFMRGALWEEGGEGSSRKRQHPDMSTGDDTRPPDSKKPSH